MLLVVLALLAGLLLGCACGGSLHRLEAVVLRRRRLVLLALLAQAAGALVGGPAHALGLLASAGLALAFLAANRGLRGTGLVALGLTANALVVGLNGAMPVSRDAAARAGVPLFDVEDGLDRRHELADDRTRLPRLGDTVPLRLPLRPEVVSPGDVLVAAGLGQLVLVAVLGGPGAPAGAGRPARPGRGPVRTPPAAPVRPTWVRRPGPGPSGRRTAPTPARTTPASGTPAPTTPASGTPAPTTPRTPRSTSSPPPSSSDRA